MRRNLFAIFTIAAVVSGVLAPIQSFAGPTATPGKSQGNGPCATSGSTNSQTQSTKNTNKECVYTVGQRGPGGGIVYYISATNFTSTGSTCNTACKYLEVAPATWQSEGVSVADDATYRWSTNTTVLTGQDISAVSTEGIAPNTYEKLNWKIGRGFYNTSVMKVSGATSAAHAAVINYVGGSSAGQWFIPSMNELNELCKYARGQTTGDLKVACTTGGTFKSTLNAGTDLGGFVGVYYWSSSENVAGSAWSQYFGNGGQGNSGKGTTFYVRPVRAF